MDALAAGASDYVTKPSNVANFAQSQANVREQLIPKVKALVEARRSVPAGARVPVGMPSPRPPTAAAGRAAAGRAAAGRAAAGRAATPAAGAGMAGQPARARPRPRQGFSALVIGCSTGGPDALAHVLPALPGDLAVPILVVQHMPPMFTKLLADRLNALCRISVVEAVEGSPVVAGTALIAPGGRHLTVVRQGNGVVVRLTEEAPEHFCRPSVDVLFRSASALYGERLLAAVLTGMGRDGAQGAAGIRAAGGEVVAQDQASSVVWGMPGAVVAAGQADRVLPLPQIGRELAGMMAAAGAPAGAVP